MMMKKLIFGIFALLLCLNLAVFVPVSAASSAPVLADNAGLLTPSQETALRSELTRISNAYNAQVAVVTIPESHADNMNRYIEDLYLQKGYGYGSDNAGVLLMVCMDPREFRIRCEGFAAEAITPNDRDTICDRIVSDLSSGDYADAFETFASECAYYLDGYINGYPFDPGSTLVIALVVGLVVGLIVALVLKGQLKSVRQQRGATGYIKPGSMQVTFFNDLFLYRNVTRTKIQTSSSSGSGGGSRSGHTGGGSF